MDRWDDGHTLAGFEVFHSSTVPSRSSSLITMSYFPSILITGDEEQPLALFRGVRRLPSSVPCSLSLSAASRAVTFSDERDGRLMPTLFTALTRKR